MGEELLRKVKEQAVRSVTQDHPRYFIIKTTERGFSTGNFFKELFLEVYFFKTLPSLTPLTEHFANLYKQLHLKKKHFLLPLI